MRCSLHSQHAAAQPPLTSHISKLSVCRCRAEERTVQHGHLQRLWCSADVVAPLSNRLISKPDEAALYTVNGRTVSQHAATTRVVHAWPQPPPALRNQSGAAASAKQPQASQVQPAFYQQQPQATQKHPLQDMVQDMVMPPAQPAANQFQLYNHPQHVQHNSKKVRRHQHANYSVTKASEAARAQQQQQQQQRKASKAARSHRRSHPRPLLQYKPCDKGRSMKHAAAISKHLQQGRQLLLPAGNVMQLARGVAALASARTLMLAHSSATGLVFQPSFPAAAAAGTQLHINADQQAEQQQQQRQAQLQGEPQHGSSIMMFISSLPEAQLRRFEQQPLIAAQYSNVSALACAAFARVCERGYTAVRAAGPNALAVALHAVTHARRKLLGCGLDLAVVPITEFVDLDSLADADSNQQQFAEYDGYPQLDYGPSDDQPRQCVRITVLHVMRCVPQQPWNLLPWQPQPEQLPAARWQQRQIEQQQFAWQQQQQQELHQPEELEVQQQPVVQHAAAIPGTDLPSFQVSSSAVNGSKYSSNRSNTNSSSSPANDIDGSLWDSAEALQGYPCGVVEVEGEDLELVKHSHAGGVVPRQHAVLLLQKQRNAKRQLVAAAQSAGHVSRGSCRSGSSNSSSGNM